MLPNSKGPVKFILYNHTLAHYHQVKMRNLQKAFFVQRVFNIYFMYFSKSLEQLSLLLPSLTAIRQFEEKKLCKIPKTNKSQNPLLHREA
jgi:hypothetical protein